MEREYAINMQIGTTCMTGALAAIGIWLCKEKSTFRSLGNDVLLSIMVSYAGFGIARNIHIHSLEMITSFCDVFFTSSTMVWQSLLTMKVYSKIGNSEDVSRTLRRVLHNKRRVWYLPFFAGLTVIAAVCLCELLHHSICTMVYSLQIFVAMAIHTIPILSVLWFYIRTIFKTNTKLMCFMTFILSEIMLLTFFIQHYFTYFLTFFDISESYYGIYFFLITLVQCISMWLLGTYMVTANLIRRGGYS